jgi:hypothetical protein
MVIEFNFSDFSRPERRFFTRNLYPLKRRRRRKIVIKNKKNESSAGPFLIVSRSAGETGPL